MNTKRPVTINKEANVQVLLSVFKEKYKGLKNAVKTENLLLDLRATGRASMTPQALRECLGEIRKHDMLSPAFIISNVHSGYWLSTDLKEIKGFLDQELDRMSNQFSNLKILHQRLSKGNSAAPKSQSSLF